MHVLDNVMGLSGRVYGVAVIVGSLKSCSQEGTYKPQCFERFQLLQKGFWLIIKQEEDNFIGLSFGYLLMF